MAGGPTLLEGEGAAARLVELVEESVHVFLGNFALEREHADHLHRVTKLRAGDRAVAVLVPVMEHVDHARGVLPERVVQQLLHALPRASLHAEPVAAVFAQRALCVRRFPPHGVHVGALGHERDASGLQLLIQRVLVRPVQRLGGGSGARKH